MDWKNDLRRTHSERSIPSASDKPTRTDTGLRDKMVSVSELVARYQTSVRASSGVKAASRHSTPGATKPERTPSPQPSRETSLEFLLRRNEERKQSGAKPSLTRSKSVGSLQNSSGSIEALMAVFEPKGAAKTKVRSSFPPASTTPNGMEEMPVVMNGEAEDMLSPAEGKKLLTENHIKYEHHESQKVGSQIQTEKRRTIGGIDFEKMAASQAEEKRKLFAEQRDNAVAHPKEVVSVSVRAISALYMSKVATQDSARKLSKPEEQRTFTSGKRTKLTKMEEDSHQAEVEDLPRASSKPLEPLQLSRETLYKQRQKCELRRLLKHTHPELKMVDDFVDEELAEVWSSEEVAAGETGYEGEVLTRRLIFENRALGDNALPSTLKIQTAHGGGERCDFNKTVLEPQTERILEDDTSFNANLELKKYSEEDLKRIDVQATRRIFENQSQSISRPNQDGSQGKVSMFGDEGSILEKQNKQSECKEREHSGDKSSTNNMEEQLQVSCNDAVAQRSGLSSHEVVCSGGTLTEQESFSDSGSQGKMIKTSAALFLNNPFISGNVEQQKSFDSESLNHQSVGAEDGLTVNVKNRTSLFESMPFDKIRHQNKEEVETLVENIKETLSFLFHVKAIHSSGAIIEVNETMKAKRAPFLLSDSGPQIDYDDVTEGGAQNLILQLLPRTNLKPQITYLKEDREGHMQAIGGGCSPSSASVLCKQRHRVQNCQHASACRGHP
ncbi:Xin actin-binding repeat-containing protein 1 [Oryzias melastigma]|uniref:Xin actin-binding repeat-containing protein 1 n=1 Tax=Oryzias melastigma TaxID=30732 RepID=A0A834F0L8_ORYME|nr:Xin actin-binding repeat-containing protein 1 [Oryzias melastigma]